MKNFAIVKLPEINPKFRLINQQRKIMNQETLNTWGIICVEGEDAANFLHSQLSNDMLTLTEHDVRIASFCTAKGRMLASFFVWRKELAFYLLCQADLIDNLVKRLTMFKLRSKCTISDRSNQFLFKQVLAPATTQLEFLADASSFLISLPCLSNNLHSAGLVVIDRNTNNQAQTPFQSANPYFFEFTLQQLGIAYICQATYEKFIPQNINFDLIGGVDFAKGCYPGQEIVARSHYLGKVKKRALLGTSTQGTSPGQDVWLNDDNSTQPAGIVVNCCDYEGQHYLLIEASIKEALEENKRFHLTHDKTDPPLTLVAPPYNVYEKGNQFAN